jgi:carbonic anhydrase
MSAVDDLLTRAGANAETFGDAGLRPEPATRVLVLACMDARLDPARVLGLRDGDAHVLRNAGGIVTDDVLRSLAISQHLLGTRAVMLLHHTDCGMTAFTDEDMAARVESACGTRPPFAFEAFADVEADVRRCVERITSCPFVPHRDLVRGFVYDVGTGSLREVA